MLRETSAIFVFLSVGFFLYFFVLFSFFTGPFHIYFWCGLTIRNMSNINDNQIDHLKIFSIGLQKSSSGWGSASGNFGHLFFCFLFFYMFLFIFFVLFCCVFFLFFLFFFFFVSFWTRPFYILHGDIFFQARVIFWYFIGAAFAVHINHF